MNQKSRVNITLELNTHGSAKKTELPFKLLCLGNYGGNTSIPISDGCPISLSSQRFSEVMQHIKPSITVHNTPITFQSIADFSPDNLLMKLPNLQKYMAIRQLLRELKTYLKENSPQRA
jgi:type VI secretion system protein ImpB